MPRAGAGSWGHGDGVPALGQSGQLGQLGSLSDCAGAVACPGTRLCVPNIATHKSCSLNESYTIYKLTSVRVCVVLCVYVCCVVLCAFLDFITLCFA